MTNLFFNRRTAAALTAIAFFAVQFAGFAAPAQANVSTWQKGAIILPTSPDDFSSQTFQQSLQNLKSTGANYVSLVIPLYQSNTGSTDVGAGWNTPTDAALASAIDYAHSIGLAVALKIHDDPYSGEWRAYINPSDRQGWFTNYGNLLDHYGQIAQAHNAEMIVIGTEMVSMASWAVNSSNTGYWQTMISNLRQIYKGKLTYDANSTNNNNDPFENEKGYIGFWSSLDYAGLSAYYDLNTGANDVQSLEDQWSYWNNNDLAQFAQWSGKQILFTEVGYRSVDNAHTQPWNWQMGGNYNAQEQANDYDALMTYWNNYPYFAGVYWWNWQSSPGAGGQGDTGYTPQNKPAQQIMQKWFTSQGGGAGGGTSGGGTPAITSSAVASPASPQPNSLTTLTATIKNTGGQLNSGVVDLEVYDASNHQVFQQYYDNQTINSNDSTTYNAQWTAGAAGNYTLAVGVFSNGWAQNYSWNGNALSITVGGSSGGDSSGGGSGSTGGGSGTGTSTPPASNKTDVWWPADGSTVSGVQPFKAMLENLQLSQYQMFWQVDNGQLNQMSDSTTDYPHKEADVDLSGWHWESDNQYNINFVSKDQSGNVIGQQSVLITVQ